jgi:hypothetical protein
MLQSFGGGRGGLADGVRREVLIDDPVADSRDVFGE